jgi:hypothetical protein
VLVLEHLNAAFDYVTLLVVELEIGEEGDCLSESLE